MPVIDSSVEQLARDAARDDSAALRQLLTMIRPDVLARCQRVLQAPEDAEEACQDALMQVHRHIREFRGDSKFTTWLYTIVGNCARQTYRSLKRRAVERADVELAAERPASRTTSVIAGTRIDLLEALERLEKERPDLAEAVVLREISQLPYDEIAQQQGVPLGTAKSRVHEGRRFLREYLMDSSPR
jgi:RNA polymerase sigma factor (sigma-70 family)